MARISRAFTSRLRSPRLTSQLGLMLGTAIGICFVTGYLSHAIQHPPRWFAWPSRPVNREVNAIRDPRVGPQGVPINQSAAGAGVIGAATDPAYRLEVIGPARTLRLSLDELNLMPQHTANLPITCVEGWSADGKWSGIRIRELVEAVGGDEGSQVTVFSLQRGGYSVSTVAPPHVRDPLTLLALRLHGETLHIDHGYPCRLIAPNRPGVMQTKWVQRLIVEKPA